MGNDGIGETAQAWVKLPDQEQAQALLAGHPYNFGFVPGMMRLVMAHPEIAPLFGALFGRIMFGPGVLERGEREMVAAVAAAAQDCRYGTQSHAEFLRVEGGDPALVEAIKRREWSALGGLVLSPRQRALCEVADKLSGTPTRMVEQDWQPLRDLGFDDRGCLEVAHIVGAFNYLTRLADGFGLQLDAGTIEAAETGVPLQRPAPDASPRT